jgi:signal transduction histidine kinase
MSSQTPQDLTLAGLVHDLNNVFETIGEAAEMLSADAKHAKLAATIRRSVNRGSRILSSFFESSLAQLEFETIHDGAVEFATDFLRAVKGPAIEFPRSIDGGIRLNGNPAAWERVLINLFLNAAQAMDKDGTVEVTARQSESEIEITVEDDGPGISPRILPNIFEPHFSTRARRSGLGLHIVQTIVTQHGGTVVASNRPSGQGACFRISVPRT